MSEELRTLVRAIPEIESEEVGLFELCIDELAGNGLPHRHEWGHDFPMRLSEMETLRDQLDEAIAEATLDEARRDLAIECRRAAVTHSPASP